MYPSHNSAMPGSGYRKSSHSGQDGNCTEVAAGPGRVLVRDTKDREGPVLAVSPAAWRRFTSSLK